MKGFPPFRGINRQVDPAAIPPNQFHHLENIRLRGGQVVSRGGQSKFSATALTGCIAGLFPSEFLFPTEDVGGLTGDRIYMIHLDIGTAPYGIGMYTSAGARVLGPNPGGVVVISSMARFQGAIILGCHSDASNAGLWRLTDQSAGASAPTKVISFSPQPAGVGRMVEFDDKLWFTLQDGAANTQICFWDGVSGTHTVSDTITSDTSVSLNSLVSSGSRLMVRIGPTLPAVDGPPRLRKYEGGAWSTVSGTDPGGGFVVMSSTGASAGFGGVAYFFGGNSYAVDSKAAVWQYTGSGNLTLAHEAVATAGLFITGVVFNDSVYYLYHRNFAEWFIGQFNPTLQLWDDIFVNASSVMGATTGFGENGIWDITSFNGSLYFIGKEARGGGDPTFLGLWKSAGANTKSWSTASPFTATLRTSGLPDIQKQIAAVL